MAIGVFDSGVGGLTVYRELIKAFPETDFIYLGDTARMPYGNRSRETIIKYALECAAYLVDNYNISGFIVACNTISSHAIKDLTAVFGLPILEVISAGAKKALSVTENHKIAVTGTRATVASKAYVNSLHDLAKRPVEVVQKACPLFVPIVEEAVIKGEIPTLIVKMYLDEIAASGADTLILGCTHYPLLADVIKELYPALKIVDSASTLVEQMRQTTMGQQESGQREVLVTYTSQPFEALKTMLVGDIPMKTVVINSECRENGGKA